MKKTGRFLSHWLGIYTRVKIPRASAALCYYLTMTLFPLIICLYTLLGSNYDRALQAVNFLEQFLSAQTVRNVRSFLGYVATHNNKAMLLAGATVLITTASAAMRSVQATIGEMQGGQRFEGLMDFVFSVIYSLAFLASMYFGMLVLITGSSFLEWINGLFPFVDISSSWQYLRFLLLGGTVFVIVWGLYIVARRKSDSYITFPGAILSTMGMVAVSLVFSAFIGVSARYPLVYGSLASMILLMFWLFLSCQVIFAGAALNITIRDLKEQGANSPG